MSETTLRLLSSAALVAVYIFMIFHSSWYYLEFYLFGSSIIFFGVKELYAFCKREDSKPFVIADTMGLGNAPGWLKFGCLLIGAIIMIGGVVALISLD
jgi:hypothetical protein